MENKIKQRAVANVEKFLDNYFTKNNRHNTSLPLLERSDAEVPSVQHILKLISLAPETTKTSIIEDIAGIGSGVSAAPLFAEKRETTLSTGYIVGIVIGLSAFLIGMIFVGILYFPKVK